MDLALPHAHVVDVELRRPVLAVERRLAAVPRADRRVHHERHRLLRDLPRGRARAILDAVAAVGAHLVRTKGLGGHAPHEGVVVIPREVAFGPRLPLHPVRPVAGVEVVQVDEPPRQRVRAARWAVGAPRGAVPAVVGETVRVRRAALTELEASVPRARPGLGGEAEEGRPEIGRDQATAGASRPCTIPPSVGTRSRTSPVAPRPW